MYYGYISILPLAFEYSTVIKFPCSWFKTRFLYICNPACKVCPFRLLDVIISEQQKYVICIYVLVHIGMWMYNGVAALLAHIRPSFYSILLNFSHTSRACCVEYRMSLQNVPQVPELHSS